MPFGATSSSFSELSNSTGTAASLKALHKKYRTLVMLITLVSAITTGGHPTLLVHSKSYHDIISKGDKVLDALTALLRRNNDIVATTVIYPPPPRTVLSAPACSETGSPLEIPGQQVSPRLWIIQQSRQQLKYPPTHPYLGMVDEKDFSGITIDGHLDYRDEFYVVEPGKSHLSAQDWDDLLIIPRNDPFSNHIATLEHYLTRCSSLLADQKQALFYDFSRYIMLSSWRRMHRRFFHWYSLAYLQRLTKVEENDVLIAFTTHSASLAATARSDAALGGLLVGIAEEDQVSFGAEGPLDLPNLLKAFSSMLGQKKAGEFKGGEGLGVYGKGTCWEFHRLLITALVAYGNALGAFQVAVRNVHLRESREAKGKGEGSSEKGRSDDRGRDMGTHDEVGTKPSLPDISTEHLDQLKTKRKDCAISLWKCAYLLWRIANSQILYHHLAVLARGSWLYIPTADGMPTKGREPPGAQRLWSAGLRYHMDGDEGGLKSEDEVIVEDNEDVEEEFHHLRDIFIQQGDLRLVFQTWISLLVSDWVDLQTVTSAISTLRDTKTSLLAPKQAKAKHANNEMEQWETTIRALAVQASQAPTGPPNTSFDAQAVIDFLKQKITEYAEDSRRDDIFRAFAPKKETPDIYDPEFYGDLHGEAVLASAPKSMDPGAEPGTILQLDIEHLNPNLIGLSQLCCPVCWELLSILGSEITCFHTRGRHLKMSPVQLPSWLPPTVMSQMVARFQHILLEEIGVLVNRGFNLAG